MCPEGSGPPPAPPVKVHSERLRLSCPAAHAFPQGGSRRHTGYTAPSPGVGGGSTQTYRERAGSHRNLRNSEDDKQMP